MGQLTTIFLCFLTVIFSSCDSESVYKEFQKTDNLEWAKNDEKTFVFKNTDSTSKYNIFFAFRYAHGFRFADVHVKIKELTPTGNNIMPLKFKVINPDGTYIGNGSGDIWDLEIPIKQNIKLPIGEYTYQITHAIPKEILYNVMDIGIIVRRTPQ